MCTEEKEKKLSKTEKKILILIVVLLLKCLLCMYLCVIDVFGSDFISHSRFHFTFTSAVSYSSLHSALLFSSLSVC